MSHEKLRIFGIKHQVMQLSQIGIAVDYFGLRRISDIGKLIGMIEGNLIVGVCCYGGVIRSREISKRVYESKKVTLGSYNFNKTPSGDYEVIGQAYPKTIFDKDMRDIGGLNLLLMCTHPSNVQINALRTSLEGIIVSFERRPDVNLKKLMILETTEEAMHK